MLFITLKKVFKNAIIILPRVNSVISEVNSMVKKRLKKEERKKIIQDISKNVFLKKGFENTTMQDIVTAADMSIGGLYHHYKNTTEIFHDIMTQANTLREIAIIQKLTNNKITLQLLSSIIVDKILADNEFVSLYIMFLKQIKENEPLRALNEQLKTESKIKLNSILSKADESIRYSDDMFDILTNIINSFLLGCELLEARKNFKSERNILEEMIEILLKKYIKIT